VVSAVRTARPFCRAVSMHEVTLDEVSRSKNSQVSTSRWRNSSPNFASKPLDDPAAATSEAHSL
jgi:hypothetical protein